jgi:ATP-dependent DNA ligase
MHLEGIVSKRADATYTPGNRGLWRKVKCLNREEFVVVGWTDPEGRRRYAEATAGGGTSSGISSVASGCKPPPQLLKLGVLQVGAGAASID